MFRVRVPATTANLGPGFDALGMALRLYNEIQVEEIKGDLEIRGCEGIPLEENLIYQGMKRVYQQLDAPIRDCRITLTASNIPMSRGLGSSAACIAAGIGIANRLTGKALCVDDMIRIGTEIEGHPDNIVPAVVGGLTVSVHQGQVTYSKVKIPENLTFAVLIPEFVLSTSEARRVLPVQYSKADCVFNLSRAAMLISALHNGELEKLRIATEDRIHQPYRGKLIPQMEDIFQQARKLGSLAEVISGSGSTLLIMIDKDNTDFKTGMDSFLETINGGWRVSVLEADQDGMQVV
ncbi:MAG: homoserine kinase [Bacillota bacterium]